MKKETNRGISERITFILGVHNHQPVGNFEHILEDSFQKAYSPFLEVMRKHPNISFALHNSGILWDWYIEKHPEYIDQIREMTSKGQIELMSGGYYEPILAVIPERDRQGQLRKMQRFIKEKFDRTPAGCWLTERIWDPNLPGTLADADLKYVVVDDSHFKGTGFSSEEMRGFFSTEENGKFVNVFPIDMNLRYLIPFHDPGETIDYFRQIAEEDKHSPKIVVLADDGEKFGLWPGTHNLCYRKNWLHRFCEMLEDNSDWIEISTFSEVIEKFKPKGIVYLPTSSYIEMMEWALPVTAQEKYRKAKDILRYNGFGKESPELLRGGLWRNFLVKYEESNWMHKRMLFVSDLLEVYRMEVGSDGEYEKARKHLYQAQCNCAYWHGLFGGLYLPHLRSAIYRNLIEAERILEKKLPPGSPLLVGCVDDMDGDGVKEIIFSNDELRVYVKLKGGTLRELDSLKPPFNLTDTLTRRRELYHQDIDKAEQKDATGEEAMSIHNISRTKENNLSDYLVYDSYLRTSFIDHFIGESTDIESFKRSEYEEIGDFIDGDYEISAGKRDFDRELILERQGSVNVEGEKRKIRLSKCYILASKNADLKVDYSVVPVDGALKCRIAVENVFSFLTGNASDRYYRFPRRKVSNIHLASVGEENHVGTFSIVDEWMDISLEFTINPSATLWRFPIETVSNSETGFERVYQGSVVTTIWSLDIGKGEEYNFSIIIKKGLSRF